MSATLKKNKIDKKDPHLFNEFILRKYINVSTIKWFKGSRNRGIR